MNYDPLSFGDLVCERDDLRAKLQAAEEENERLRVFIEPKEWKGWDQIDSIYEEARLLRGALMVLVKADDALQETAITSPEFKTAQEEMDRAYALARQALGEWE